MVAVLNVLIKLAVCVVLVMHIVLHKKLEELGLGSVSKGPREGYLFKAEKPWPTG